MQPATLFRKLFDRGRSAACQYIVDEPLGYICPICLRVITDLRDLSKEHVPPRAIGGRVLCLTCKQCNNSSGHSIDAAVVERLEMANTLKVGTQQKFLNLEIEGVKINASAMRRGSSLHFQIEPHHNSPAAIGEFLSKSKKLNSDLKMQVWFRNSYSERLALVGYLRIAYLYLFAKLGYSYILHESLDPVREQIKRPNEEIIYQWWLERKEGLANEVVYFCDKPFTGSVVALHQYLIILPAVAEPYDQYKKLNELTSNTAKGDYLGEMHFSKSFSPPRTMELIGDFLHSRNAE
jgi:hypothetical protein